MDTAASDGAAVRFPPPFVYAIALVAGALLQGFVLPLPFGVSFGARVAVAAVAAGLGVALITGIYRYTRNPMYVGMALLQLAIGVGFGNLWIVALLPLVLAIIYAIAIRHEEAYLERKFGETYLAYKRSVRRWL